MSVSFTADRELLRIKADHAALRFGWELQKCAYRGRKFRPDQLRVPKGEEGAGQFAPEGENSSAQPAFFAPAVALAEKTIEAAIALYLGLSNLGSTEQQPVITFNSKGYSSDGEGNLNFESVAALSRSDIESACPRFEEVQQLTDLSVDRVRASQSDLRPAEFGTAVHTNLKNQVNELSDENLQAEVSYIKTKSEARYGERGSIRVDVLERVGDGTVCVYDIKTGRSGLGVSRMREIAQNVYTAFPDTSRIVVTEVRPRR